MKVINVELFKKISLAPRGFSMRIKFNLIEMTNIEMATKLEALQIRIYRKS